MRNSGIISAQSHDKSIDNFLIDMDQGGRAVPVTIAKTLLSAQEVRLEVHQRKLEALQHRIRVLCKDADPSVMTTSRQAKEMLQAQGTEPVGFLQFFNTWRFCYWPLCSAFAWSLPA